MGFLFFAWHPPRRFRVRPPPCPSLTSLITALLITPHSSQHYSSHLTHHSTTHHTSLITPLVNHTTLSHHSTTHHITPHSSQHYSSHHLSITPRCRVEGAVHRVWQAQYAGPSGGARSCCARGRRLARGWRSCGRRCCARGRHLARGWRLCGRRSTQGLLEELLRAWSSPGPRLAFVWQVHYTEPSGGAAARVVAGWPAAGFRVAGAVHRASWRSCCHTTLSHTPSFTHHLSHHFVTHHLSHAIFDTPSFTHHLSHTIFDTPFFTHHLLHTTLSPTIFDTPSFTHRHRPSFTHHFVTHHLSHNFVTHHLSHTVTDHLSHTTLSHTIFDTPSFTQLCHTPSFTTPSLSHTIFHHTIFHTHNFVTHHLSSTSSFVFPSFPVPATTFLAHYWKKLTCGVIRSFYFFFIWLARGLQQCIAPRVAKMICAQIDAKYGACYSLIFSPWANQRWGSKVGVPFLFAILS